MSLSDLVEMEIGGVSVTPRGLAAILVPAGGAKDALPRASNAVETLRGAEVDVVPREFASAPALAVLVTDTDADADAATSEYAQAMMQYLQDPPCDMGIQLPYDALDRVTGGSNCVGLRPRNGTAPDNRGVRAHGHVPVHMTSKVNLDDVPRGEDELVPREWGVVAHAVVDRHTRREGDALIHFVIALALRVERSQLLFDKVVPVLAHTYHARARHTQ